VARNSKKVENMNRTKKSDHRVKVVENKLTPNIIWYFDGLKSLNSADW
jgi:hypothetical protein